MALPSVTSPHFLERVDAALAVEGELIVLHRPAYAAGLKLWALVRSREDLVEFIRSGQPRSSFVVFLRREVPLRGTVERDLIRRAIDLLQQHRELLLLELDAAGGIVDDTSLEDAAEVEAWLAEREGRQVAVGRYPPFWLDDGDEVIGAYCPDPDGVVRSGAY
jgi:hypothetical protein